MPIKFRCQHCRQFLGISRDQAGTVTDCPTCGRTIRIPHLDGSVDPLPNPELDLGDSHLASALDKLAGIEEGAGQASDFEDETRPVPDKTPKKVVAERLHVSPAVVEVTPEVVPAAESSQEAPAQVVVTDEKKKASRPSTPPPVPDLSPLDELARQAPPAVLRSTSRDSVARRVIIGVIALTLLAVGFTAGRLSAPGVSSEPDVEQSSDHEVNRIPEAGGPVPKVHEDALALTGRITYVSASGDTHPDSGARVLVLPSERSGSSKLPIDGFRSGAEASDVELARVLAQSAGGGFDFADADGQFQITLAKAGEYQVLMMSRYQPREDTTPLTPDVRQLLEKYFDRPDQLLGQTEFHVSSFRYRGEGSAPRDYTFTR